MIVIVYGSGIAKTPPSVVGLDDLQGSISIPVIRIDAGPRFPTTKLHEALNLLVWSEGRCTATSNSSYREFVPGVLRVIQTLVYRKVLV